MTNEVNTEAETAVAPLPSAPPTATAVVPMTTDGTTGSCVCAAPAPPRTPAVYSLGHVDVCSPNKGWTDAFKKALLKEKIPPNKPTRELLYTLLKKASPTASPLCKVPPPSVPLALLNPSYLYLAQEVCWVWKVQGTHVYQLYARYDTDFVTMLDSLQFPIAEQSSHGLPPHMGVLIGERIASPASSACAALPLPTVMVSCFRNLDVDAFAKHRCESLSTCAEGEKPKCESSAKEFLYHIYHEQDNLGATDAHRALNYLAVNSTDLYKENCNMMASEHSLPQLHVVPRATLGTEVVMDARFIYANEHNVETTITATVDVNYLYPFGVGALCTNLS